MLKKVAYGIMIGLLACSVVAGCGGGNKGGSSGGSTSTSSSIKKPDVELKFGSYTAKMYKIENSAQLFLGYSTGKVKRLSIDGKDLYAITAKGDLAKLKIDAMNKTIAMDNPLLTTDLWNNSQVSANSNGVYYVKKSRLYFYGKTRDKEQQVINKFTQLEAINGNSGYMYMNQGPVNKVELKGDGVISKVGQEVRPHMSRRRGGKDSIGANCFILTDTNGFYVFGDGGAKQGVPSHGIGVWYDKDNKIKATYGGEKNQQSMTDGPGYIAGAGDAAVTNRYVVFCDKTRGNVHLFERSSGRFLGTLSYDEVGGPQTKYINLARVDSNKVLVVAGNASSQDKLDRIWLMEF